MCPVSACSAFLRRCFRWILQPIYLICFKITQFPTIPHQNCKIIFGKVFNRLLIVLFY